MNSLSPRAPEDKPHYTYVLEYPESYPEPDKAGTVFYVGKGSDDRIDEHEREARKGGQSYKCNVIRKILANGYRVVKKILAFFETHEEACTYEIALIFFLPNLTNLTYGGDGMLGYVFSEEAKHKISSAQKGKSKWSIEDRQKISERQTGRPRGDYSEEHCRNISTAKMGHSVSQATRQKLSKANSNPSPEYRKKLSEAHKGQVAWNKGKPMSEAAKQKLSESQKQRLAAKKQATNHHTPTQ